MNGESLKSRVIKTEPSDWKKFQFIQQEDFKELGLEAMSKLKKSILDDHFIQPFYVWQDPEGAVFCLDGKHRTVNGSIHYIFMDWRHMWHMTEAGRRVYGSAIPKQMCVWNKDIMANGSFYRAQQELCFVFHSPQAKALWHRDIVDKGGFYKDEDELCFIFKSGDAKHLSHLELKNRIRTNVWNYPSAISTANPDRYELKNHPTPKPVAMIADAILDTTYSGDIVIDWFLGSGTCLIACEHTQRRGRFTEIEPKYVEGDIIRFINYCHKRNLSINFTHENGNLKLEDFYAKHNLPADEKRNH